ncbi:hypothetical protein P879_06003 [Paragonimus westermani]|uniref:Large ribosomal subunit protein mL53 n=1 Tax=Paragonimus westermani TaxID=34504 RepID=A0A8T0D6A1_9TREM|nr:hypothetical protein P879_06003 [Paragonimus westermani]
MSFTKYRHLPPKVRYFVPVRAVDESVVSKNILKQLDLKPLKSISFSYNPFVGNVESIRRMCSIVSDPKWRATNPNLLFKTKILSDYSPPIIELNYSNGNIVLLKTENLSLREIIEIVLAQSARNVIE